MLAVKWFSSWTGSNSGSDNPSTPTTNPNPSDTDTDGDPPPMNSAANGTTTQHSKQQSLSPTIPSSPPSSPPQKTLKHSTSASALLEALSLSFVSSKTSTTTAIAAQTITVDRIDGVVGGDKQGYDNNPSSKVVMVGDVKTGQHRSMDVDDTIRTTDDDTTTSSPISQHQPPIMNVVESSSVASQQPQSSPTLNDNNSKPQQPATIITSTTSTTLQQQQPPLTPYPSTSTSSIPPNSPLLLISPPQSPDLNNLSRVTPSIDIDTTSSTVHGTFSIPITSSNRSTLMRQTGNLNVTNTRSSSPTLVQITTTTTVSSTRSKTNTGFYSIRMMISPLSSSSSSSGGTLRRNTGIPVPPTTTKKVAPPVVMSILKNGNWVSVVAGGEVDVEDDVKEALREAVGTRLSCDSCDDDDKENGGVGGLVGVAGSIDDEGMVDEKVSVLERELVNGRQNAGVETIAVVDVDMNVAESGSENVEAVAVEVGEESVVDLGEEMRLGATPVLQEESPQVQQQQEEEEVNATTAMEVDIVKDLNVVNEIEAGSLSHLHTSESSLDVVVETVVVETETVNTTIITTTTEVTTTETSSSNVNGSTTSSTSTNPARSSSLKFESDLVEMLKESHEKDKDKMDFVDVEREIDNDGSAVAPLPLKKRLSGEGKSDSGVYLPRISFRERMSSAERKMACRKILDHARQFFSNDQPQSPTTPTPNIPFPSSNNIQQPSTDPNQLLSLSVSTDSSMSSSVALINASSLPPPSPSRILSQNEFVVVTVGSCGLPKHLNSSFFRKIVEMARGEVEGLREATGGGGASEGEVDEVGGIGWDHFERFVNLVVFRCLPDLDKLVFEILVDGKGRDYVVYEDLEVVVKDVLENHPAFEFLNGSPAFQTRFTETVITRLFYLNPKSGRGRITLREFRRIGFIKMLNDVEAAASSLGANMPSPFSYKDFYVIYCKFWELDRDRDMQLTLSDLEFYGRRALSRAALSRVIECHGCKDKSLDHEDEGYLGFKEFVTFILSVEDKTTDSGLDYWFRVLDLDGDGVLSLLELETFWEHQQIRLPEHYKIEDFFSMILDLIQPGGSYLTQMDMKKSRASAGLFLDMLLDCRRHMENVRRSTDGAFRMRDEVWTEVEVEGAAAGADGLGLVVDDDGDMMLEGGGHGKVVGGVRRYRLEGWEKFAERAYRDLASPSPAQNQSVAQDQEIEEQTMADDAEILAMGEMAVDTAVTWMSEVEAHQE
ncbi:hypothetical protein HDU76_001133 [Blyttiomyces sp. JEL0837]|nr:hypothetical protein HDU76_001133 [Blyttiomyces sp. JEL0837]